MDWYKSCFEIPGTGTGSILRKRKDLCLIRSLSWFCYVNHSVQYGSTGSVV